MTLFLFLLGCPNKDVGTSPDDTDTPVVEDGDNATWTPGPALPECTPETGNGTVVALSGVVLLPDEAVAGHVVYDKTTGSITCAGADCDTSGATVVCTEGVVSPGLIDTHDHMQYNVLAPWRHDELYNSRYDWQSDGDYWDYREAYDEVWDSDYDCEIGWWAELRVLAGGGTTAVGRSGPDCLDNLVRNLDEDSSSHGFDGYEAYYNSGKVQYLDNGDATKFQSDLGSGRYGVVMHHVAEGVGGSVRDEIDRMTSLGMTGPGITYIHATDATTEQLAQMAADGTSLIWSPRSNLDLYAETTLADVALRIGVPVALGPDWTWSGSAHLTSELDCAYDYLSSRGHPMSDVTLWSLSTHEAARVLGLDGFTGSLQVGLAADIAVFPYSETPWRSIIEAGSDDVQLTIVGGQALYGAPDLVESIADEACQTVTACSEERSYCTDVRVEDVETTLSAALGAVSMPSSLDYANDLFGLWQCDERPTCDMAVAVDSDADGDGIDDDVDLCPSAWDPNQEDHDGDGEGDACDPCPLFPDGTTCAHEQSDLDGDGVNNDVDICPWLHDDGTDSDGDKKGDACDECPNDANPGGAPCPASMLTISDIRDPSSANYPGENSNVTVQGIVTAVRDGGGFMIQDATATEFGAIYVFDHGDNAVALGDDVTVTGLYVEYFDLSEIEPSNVTKNGTATVPTPISVSPCDVGTGGSKAEALESMLVTVADVEVTDANPDSPDDYGEFEVEDCLRVDDWLCEDCWATQPSVGTAYDSLTGIVVYSFSNSKITPRDASDM
jgi:large repetitive protein